MKNIQTPLLITLILILFGSTELPSVYTISVAAQTPEQIADIHITSLTTQPQSGVLLFQDELQTHLKNNKEKNPDRLNPDTHSATLTVQNPYSQNTPDTLSTGVFLVSSGLFALMGVLCLFENNRSIRRRSATRKIKTDVVRRVGLNVYQKKYGHQ